MYLYYYIYQSMLSLLVCELGYACCWMNDHSSYFIGLRLSGKGFQVVV